MLGIHISIIMLYTLNAQNAVCQLYLNKAEKLMFVFCLIKIKKKTFTENSRTLIMGQEEKKET